MNTIPHHTDTSNGQAASQPKSDSMSLQHYHRIVLLTEGFSTPFLAKTAISLLRYRREDILAVLDATQAGQTTQTLLGAGGDLPVIDSLELMDADALFIGIAPPGGALPVAWRPIVTEALGRGIDVVSGLHDFLSADPEFVSLAKQHGARLIDVRRNTIRDTAQGVPFRDGCLRIHTVGHDCSVGKMVVALEVQQALVKQNVDAQFLATGQTGIMISGAGIPIDCVVADFVNGAAETLVKQNEQHDVLLIEGQGCISHPSFSAVTLGLLHGCAPDGLIFCYEVGRTMAKGYDQIQLLSHRRLIDAYEANAALRHPCRVIGVAMNSRNVSADEAAEERQRVSEELGLPVCDVYRDGPATLVDAVWKLKQERQR